MDAPETNVSSPKGRRNRFDPLSFLKKESRVTDQQLDEQSQNPVKDPDDWTTGDEPMTGPQASYLATLLQQAGRPESDLDASLTKAEASKLIDELQAKTGRGQETSEASPTR